MIFACAAQPVLRKYSFFVFALIFVFGSHWWPSSVSAQSVSGGVLVVGNDRGGVIGTRADEIRRLNRSGHRVEIRGQVCLSSCTMYLGAGNVCISPRTRFGFHGPSYYGRPLGAQDFQYWSEVIAAHYPATIRRWFMETGRHKRQGYFTIPGSELIRHGVPRCQGAPA